MSVARSYVNALFQTLQEKNLTSAQMDLVETQMDQVVAVFRDSADLKQVLFGPVVATQVQVAIIDAISTKMSLDPVFAQFLSLLTRKGRLSLFEKMREEFAATRLTHEGAVAGQVVSAGSMSEADLKSLEKAFGQKLGKRVVFRRHVDASLLAGMRVTLNGVTYDGTLRAQLQRLRECFVTGYAGGLSV